MKISLIIPTLNQGGAERVMSELGNQFHEMGHQVSFVLLVNGEDFYNIHPAIEIHRLGFSNSGRLNKIFNEAKLFLSLRKLLKKESPDTVLSFGDKFNVFTILASRNLNLKVFVSDRSNPNKIIPRLTGFLRKKTYPYATGIIAQTSLAKQVLLKKTNHQNIKVIPNPLKSILIEKKVVKEKIILSIGRLVPEKGQIFLIRALSKLDNQDWKVVILGDGLLKNDLEYEAKNLGVESRLVMPGAVKNVDEWLARASIFVLPSISEGFPNSLVEAMAAGLPVVSFDCNAGPRDIINNNQNGFLIPLKAVEPLAEKIDELIRNPSLREELGRNAKEVNRAFEKRTIASLYLNFMSNN